MIGNNNSDYNCSTDTPEMFEGPEEFMHDWHVLHYMVSCAGAGC